MTSEWRLLPVKTVVWDAISLHLLRIQMVQTTKEHVSFNLDGAKFGFWLAV